MTQEEIEKRDIEFFKAFAEDGTLNRAAFNAEYEKKNKKVKPVYKCVFENIKAPTEEHKKIYDAFKQYTDKFPKVKTPNILITGGTGTGKTFAIDAIKKKLINRGFDVQYTTAFNMVKEFQKYNNSFWRDSEQIDIFIECGLLIVDDLGTESTMGNMTNGHIYNIINERLVNGRPFIITTNLTPKEIEEKYDSRITSRILSKETTASFIMKGKDLRLS